MLRVTFLDVGQGDGCVIEGPTDRVVVVDGGGGAGENNGGDPGARVVVPYLRARGINTVDLVVATHPHDDHVQGLIAVADRLRVRQALDGDYPDPPSPTYRRWRAHLAGRGVPVACARRGQKIDLGGGATITVLGPPPRVLGGRSPENNHSIVLRVAFGRAAVLLTGDAESEAEADLLARGYGPNLRADVLKVAHHGSRWSSTAPFLNAVRPRIAVISCGRRNVFGHPHRETLARLAQQHVRVFRTDQNGAVTMETDGRTIRVTPTLALR